MCCAKSTQPLVVVTQRHCHHQSPPPKISPVFPRFKPIINNRVFSIYNRHIHIYIKHAGSYLLASIHAYTYSVHITVSLTQHTGNSLIIGLVHSVLSSERCSSTFSLQLFPLLFGHYTYTMYVQVRYITYFICYFFTFASNHFRWMFWWNIKYNTKVLGLF